MYKMLLGPESAVYLSAMDNLRSLGIALGKIELRGLASGSYHVTDHAEEKVYP